jgi:hypothetical protein
MVPGALTYRMSIARANMSVKSSTKMIPANVLFIIHHSLLYQPHLCLKLYFKFPKAIQKGSASSIKKKITENLNRDLNLLLGAKNSWLTQVLGFGLVFLKRK